MEDKRRQKRRHKEEEHSPVFNDTLETNPKSLPLELFVLNEVTDALLLFEEETLFFVNESFFQQYDKHNNFSHDPLVLLEDGQISRFYECIRISNSTGQRIFERFNMKNIDQSTHVNISFIPYGQKKTCCKIHPIKFSDTKAEETTTALSSADLTRFHWLDTLDKYSGPRVVLEYDEAWKDFVIVFSSAAENDSLFRRMTKASSKYLIRSGIFSADELAKWTPMMLNVSNQSHPVVVNGEMFGNPETSYQLSSLGWISITGRMAFLLQSNKAAIGMEKSKTESENIIEQYKVMKTFFDNTPMFLGSLKKVPNELDFVYQYTNPYSAKFFGIDTEMMKGLRMSSLGLPSDQHNFIANEILKSKEGPKARLFETKIHSKTFNKKAYLSVIACHVQDDQFIFLGQDCEARKEMEDILQKKREDLEEMVRARTKQLENALQVKSRFLAIMSHEIRTPLSGILGMISLLSESELTPEKHEMIRIAQVCSEQLLVIINDILDLTKMDENKMNLESLPFSLVSVIEDSLEVVSFNGEQKKIELISEFDPISLVDKVIGDPLRLRQILVNLLSNAVKFSKEDGEVIVTATSCDVPSKPGYCNLSFSVIDQGIGIPESSKSMIFEPFSQADTSITRKYGGSGLGLSISKHLAQMMGGDVWFKSEVGQGSTFYFNIILKKDTENATSSHDTCDQSSQILIVDRCARMAATLRDRLKTLGYNIDVIPYSSDIHTQIEPNKYGVALIDGRIGGDALGVIGKLVPRILVTGYTQYWSDNFSFLKKPIRHKQLLSLLRGPEEPTKRTKDGLMPTRKNSFDLQILVAEDNKMNQIVIEKLLRSIGYQNITIAENGKKALEAMETVNFDIILMDIMMPEMSGLAATEKIRSSFPPERQPYILALTANAFSEDRIQCLKSGMDDVLTKPINQIALRNKLDQCPIRMKTT